MKEVRVRAGLGQQPIGPFSLAFGPGLTALTGRNGSGKTTMIKSIAGLLQSCGGRIRRLDEGKEITLMELRLRLGYVPQDISVHDDMSLRGYLTYVGELKCLNRRFLPGEVLRVARLLGLEGELERRVKETSEGRQRRLMIAQALMGRPRLLLMDEPFAGVDLEYRRRLLLYLQEYAAVTEAAVLVATHNVEEIEPGDYGRIITLP